MSEFVVTVKQGKLKGCVVKNVLQSTYVAFKGIPFAAPPVGDLRFKDPQPPQSWSGVRDTSEVVANLCTQVMDIPPYDVIGDEDCLHLNVYTKSFDQKKPVMFWIHGGAFVSGSSSFEHTRPDYLIEKDVVVVTAQYRLGALGFLNLGHRVAPGNLGLKDLIAALEWVKENIANFGGDPGNVTIFGVSAGGALTQFLTYSPRAKGLFHKAILQSGTAISPWNINQSRPDRGFKLAAILGKNSTDPEEVIEFLRTIPAKDIAKAQSKILAPEETLSYSLAFGLNCDEISDNPVLPRPLNELDEANVPLMLGSTSHEFIMFFKDKSEQAFNAYNQYLPVHVKNVCAMKQLNEKVQEAILDEVKKVYFDGKPISEETIPGLIRFMNDMYFRIPAHLVAETRAKKTTVNTYLYKYSYVGTELTLTDLLGERIVSGASHGDEVAYLFYLPLCKIENPDAPAIGTKDRINLERMTSLWTNFAKTGNPTSSMSEFVKATWKPFTAKDLYYMEIGDELRLTPSLPHILSNK